MAKPPKQIPPARACFLLVIDRVELTINRHFRYWHIAHWGRGDFYLGGKFGPCILTIKIRVLQLPPLGVAS